MPILTTAGLLAVAAPLAAQTKEPPEAWPVGPVPSASELQARGARIGAIEIVVRDVFDRNDPRENNALYRFANTLHIETRPAAIRAQLLFAEGERLIEQRLRETERILRTRKYLFDAWVRPVRYDAVANTVEIAVVVQDVWTLNPGVSIGRGGGRSKSKFEIEDSNFLGLGKSVSVGRSSDVDRASWLFQYDDPNLAGSWWRLDLRYATSSDGDTRYLNLEHPYYSLTSPWAAGTTGLDTRYVQSRYALGHVVDRFAVDRQAFDLYGGRSLGLENGWVQRWLVGIRQDDRRFAALPGEPTAIPGDRKFVYPYLGWQVLEDRYVEDENLDQIGRTEDVYYGRHLRLTLGYASRSLDSTANAVMLTAAGGAGWELSPKHRLFLDAEAHGQMEQGSLRDAVLKTEARYYYRYTSHQLFFAGLSGTVTEDLAADQQLLLGGDNGLRGYPVRFLGGSSSALLTLEHRIFTDWYPFRLVRVGAAAFFDAGRTWGRGPVSTPDVGTLKDIGIGLRLGNTRSGLGNVLHIDFAYALDRAPGADRYQFVIETRERF